MRTITTVIAPPQFPGLHAHSQAQSAISASDQVFGVRVSNITSFASDTPSAQSKSSSGQHESLEHRSAAMIVAGIQRRIARIARSGVPGAEAFVDDLRKQLDATTSAELTPDSYDALLEQLERATQNVERRCEAAAFMEVLSKSGLALADNVVKTFSPLLLEAADDAQAFGVLMLRLRIAFNEAKGGSELPQALAVACARLAAYSVGTAASQILGQALGAPSQLVQSVVSMSAAGYAGGRWAAAQAAVMPLLGMLPSMRASIPTVEAVIASLSETVTDAAQALHDGINQADEALSPSVPPLDGVMAAGAVILLYELQRRINNEAATHSNFRQPLASFLSKLPGAFSWVAGANRLVGKHLGAPQDMPAANPGPALQKQVQDLDTVLAALSTPADGGRHLGRAVSSFNPEQRAAFLRASLPEALKPWQQAVAGNESPRAVIQHADDEIVLEIVNDATDDGTDLLRSSVSEPDGSPLSLEDATDLLSAQLRHVTRLLDACSGVGYAARVDPQSLMELALSRDPGQTSERTLEKVEALVRKAQKDFPPDKKWSTAQIIRALETGTLTPLQIVNVGSSNTTTGAYGNVAAGAAAGPKAFSLAYAEQDQGSVAGSARSAGSAGSAGRGNEGYVALALGAAAVQVGGGANEFIEMEGLVAVPGGGGGGAAEQGQLIQRAAGAAAGQGAGRLGAKSMFALGAAATAGAVVLVGKSRGYVGKTIEDVATWWQGESNQAAATPTFVPEASRADVRGLSEAIFPDDAVFQGIDELEATFVMNAVDGTLESAEDQLFENRRHPGRLVKRSAGTPMSPEMESRRAIQLALADHFASLPDARWLQDLSDNERRQWVVLYGQLEGYHSRWQGSSLGASQALDAELRKQGWTRGAKGLSVRLPSAFANGQPLPVQMPLLQYCLYGDPAQEPVAVSHGNRKLSDQENMAVMRAVKSGTCQNLKNGLDDVPGAQTTIGKMVEISFKMSALEAKAKGELTGGSRSVKRGLDIVVAFTRGEAYVESSPLVFTGLSDANAGDKYSLPGYLVLRSGQDDPDAGRRGQVVLYNTSLDSLRTFETEAAFRQFISERQAAQSTAVENGFIEDVIASAPVGKRDQLRRMFYEDNYLARPEGWSRQAHIEFDYRSTSSPGSSFADWAEEAGKSLLSSQRSSEAASTAAQGWLWSPLGMQVRKVTGELKKGLESVQNWQDHARPKVFQLINEQFARGRHGGPHTVAGPLTSDHRVSLAYNGTEMDVAAAATVGWKKLGIEASGGERTRFGASGDKLRVTVTKGGQVDKAATALLNGGIFPVRIAQLLDTQYDRDDLRSEYQRYLADFPATDEGGTVVDMLASAMLWRMRGLVDVNNPASAGLDAATRKRLQQGIERMGGPGTPLRVVTLGESQTVIDGLWAVRAGQRSYVFALGLPTGDRLMTEDELTAFLREDRRTAEEFIASRAAHRSHPELNALFGHTQTSAGLSVGFAEAPPLRDVARNWFTILADNASYLKGQPKSAEEWLEAAARVGHFAACLASATGIGAAVCAAGSAGFAMKGILDGVEALEQGQLGLALREMLGAGAEAASVLSLGRISKMLFHTSRKSVETTAEVAEAVLEFAGQAATFDVAGMLLSGGSALLPGASPLLRTGDGAPEFARETRRWVQAHDGGLVETITDEHGIRRVVDELRPERNNAAIEYRNGAWRRREEVPHQWWAATTPAPLAGASQAEKALVGLSGPVQDKLRAMFGLRGPAGTVNSYFQTCVVNERIRDRLQQMTDAPSEMGLPDDMVPLLAAWSRSALGEGKGIRLYVAATDDVPFEQGVLFGSRTVGVYIPVSEAGAMPSLQGLVDAVGQAEVARRLGLPPDVPRERLLISVKETLAEYIRGNRDGIVDSWNRWLQRTEVLTPLSDTVHQKFPALSKPEAQSMARDSPEMRRAASAWSFGPQQMREAAEQYAIRRKAMARELILEGNPNTLDAMQELSSHLQSLFPQRLFVLAGSSPGVELKFNSKADGSGTWGGLSVMPGQLPHRTGANGVAVECATWQDCVHAQLLEVERSLIPTPDSLKRRVQERMAVTPLASACAPSSSGGNSGRVRHKRDTIKGGSCPVPPVAAGPSADILPVMNEVKKLHSANVARMWSTVPVSNYRLEDPDKLSAANVATWRLELERNGVEINLGDLPKVGSAVSGQRSLPDMTEGQPLRRVLLPVTDKKVFENVYPDVYGFGADATQGSASRVVTLKEKDLRLIGRNPKFAKRAIDELSQTELDELTMREIPIALKKVFCNGNAPLKRNVEELRRGIEANPEGVELAVYDIRSCAEGKIFDALVPALRGGSVVSRPESELAEVSGKIAVVFTDMDPCSSCARRFKALKHALPNVEIVVQSYFTDAKERAEIRGKWIAECIDENRGKWEQEGLSDQEISDRATADWYLTPLNRPARTWNSEAADNDDPI